MSQRPISLSPDLKRLRDEGYSIEIVAGHLVLREVPYVNAAKEVKRGVLVSKLTLANDMAVKPEDHVVSFGGQYPCHVDGTEIAKIKNQTTRNEISKDLVTDFTFSAKPVGESFANYYDKMTNYVAILCGPAEALEPGVTAKTFRVVEATEAESVFKYIDTASSRAEITSITAKLEVGKVAILGMGGTGSYVLDLIAKTPIKEIHLFDGDKFLQHNAFRSPGAPSGEELGEQLPKVTYFEKQYSKMRRGIIGHPNYISSANIELLKEMSFVFICLDRGAIKRLIIEKLEDFGISFIDVGMGVDATDGALGGVLRVTTSTFEKRDHIRTRISFADGDGNNEYNRNIQIADLNALNAALAVIKWKKLMGFFRDLDHEHHSTFTIDGNMLLNEDKK